jgi:hypothetical protein
MTKDSDNTQVTLIEEDKTAQEDIEFVRNSYYNLINYGNEALEEMIEVAKSTEHPRAYEVLSNMLKHVSELNGNLLDLHKKKKEINKEEQEKILENNKTTNNLFVGSTTELQKMLSKVNDDNNNSQEDIIDVTPEED